MHNIQNYSFKLVTLLLSIIALALLLLPSFASAATVRCELEVSDERIERGEEVELEWETSNATEVKLKDNHGNVLFDTDDFLNRDKKEWFDGDMTIKPTKDTTYTLIAERGNTDRECEVEVRVDEDRAGAVVLSEYREQLPLQRPVVAGVPLAQVPYTGVHIDTVFGTAFASVAAVWLMLALYHTARRRKTGV